MALYPALEPYAQGMLDVGDGQSLYWEEVGSRDGKPAVVLHGGPGAGCHPVDRQLFDPAAYRVVLFDQRGAQRSRPHAALATTSLVTNTTPHLLEDIERVRVDRGIERWLVLGVSWGATLALVYAETHPERVTELVLGAVTNGTRAEVDWMYRTGAPRFFPEAWDRFRAHVPEADRDGDLVEAYARLLADADPPVRQAAADAWCRWELSYIDFASDPEFTGRFADPAFRMTFARIVTHYFRHDAWLQPGQVLRDAGRLRGIPGTMVHSRLDLGGPLDVAWRTKQAWPDADLVVLDEPGHAAAGMDDELARATDRYR